MLPVFRLMCRQHGLIIGYHAIALAHNPILYLTQQADGGRLREHVTRLATGERHSLYSPAHHAEAADYISTAFQGGLATRQHTFDIRGRSGMNIIYPQIRPFLEHRAYPRNKISETRISSQGEGAGVEAKLGQ